MLYWVVVSVEGQKHAAYKDLVLWLAAETSVASEKSPRPGFAVGFAFAKAEAVGLTKEELHAAFKIGEQKGLSSSRISR